MPFVSRKQERWAYTPSGLKALGGKNKVREWQSATDQRSLPEKKGGALKTAAKRLKK